MTIKNIEKYTTEQLKQEVARGGKFVFFSYTISLVVMTTKRNSSIVFIPAGEGTFKRRVGFSSVNLIMGWWGIPWGPIHTIGSMITNVSGGKDVTAEIVSHLGLNAHVGYNVPVDNPAGAASYGNQQGASAYNIPGTNNQSSQQNSNNNPTYNIPR